MSPTIQNRLTSRFAQLKAEGRSALVTFITGGDPDYETSLKLLNGLPGAGADVIELGMPFSDPMADGPSIQKAAIRALSAGADMTKTLSMVKCFRKDNDTTPIVLMGYYNPIYQYGCEKFAQDAAAVGVDGLIIVDLPPEEDKELRIHADAQNISVIRLATPTSNEKRLEKILDGASGFLYYVSMTGVTGTKDVDSEAVAKEITRLRQSTDLPIAVGFGIKTPESAGTIAKVADAAVVGSALVDKIAQGLDADGKATDALVDQALDFTRALAEAVKNARN